MPMCGTPCLSATTAAIGVIGSTCSVAGIGLSLFLIFGDPWPDHHSQGTYTPHWEDIGPAIIVAVVSLLANLLLIGGARQLSKDFLLVWIVWKSFALIIFWAWYGYSQLKHYGYIDWTEYGMKDCNFCTMPTTSMYVVFGGVVATVVILFCMVPVEILRSRLKKRQRELTETLGYYGGGSQQQLPYNYEMSHQAYLQQQRELEMQQQHELEQLQQQRELERQHVLQQYQQYPPPQQQQQQYYYQQQHYPQMQYR